MLITGSDWQRTQPEVTTYAPVYQLWHPMLRRRGYDLLRGSVQWFNGRRFTKHWRRNQDGSWEKVRRPLVPSVVYDLTHSHDRKTGDTLPFVYSGRSAISSHTRLVNAPEFSALFDNKLAMAVIFGSHMPAARLLQAGDVVRNPRRRHVVLKRLEGSGGEQVLITKAARVPVTYTALEQEFIPAVHGDHVHDIRIVFVGERPIFAMERHAPRGSLYTNFHLGAQTRVVSLASVAPVVRKARELSTAMRVFRKKVYSMDFLIDRRNRRPVLIETNTMPGLASVNDKTRQKFLLALTEHLTTW